MKTIFSILALIFVFQVQADCKPGEIRHWSKDSGYACIERVQDTVSDCVTCDGCLGKINNFEDLFSSFPNAIYRPDQIPWWALQGNLQYPNLHYPGAWNNKKINPGIEAKYYPGEGEVHALKPNIYIESVHDEKKFNFAFTSKEELSFLATTPPLDEKNNWKGKIINKDRFEVEGIYYDYLFYDIRLPKAKMQFERGLCTNRDEAIKWMLQDLTEMKYPPIALQDFEEHWKVKIPDLPFYCIYPQYNQQLDAVLPVSIGLEQSQLIRSLYVLIAHKKEPDMAEPQAIPFPTLDSAEIRPVVSIKYENMFKEWGVAFLGE